MKDIAVFTLSKNENYFLPKWINYYSKFFDTADMYVLDHESDDGSTDNLKVNVKKIYNNNTLDTAWGTQNVTEFAAELLKNYRFFLHTDTDEFIITTDGSNLRTYLDNNLNKYDCFISTGYNLIHNKLKEPTPFNPNLPLLSQRTCVKPIVYYDKPFMANYPLQFNVGEHTANNEKRHSPSSRNDPNLIMLHCKLYDQDSVINRLKSRYQHINVNHDDPEANQCRNIAGDIDRFMQENYNQYDLNNCPFLNQILKYDFTKLF